MWTSFWNNESCAQSVPTRCRFNKSRHGCSLNRMFFELFCFWVSRRVECVILVRIHQRCEEVREGYVRCTTVLVSKTFVTSLYAPTSEYVVGQVWSMLREARLIGAECFFLSVNINVKFGITKEALELEGLSFFFFEKVARQTWHVLQAVVVLSTFIWVSVAPTWLSQPIWEMRTPGRLRRAGRSGTSCAALLLGGARHVVTNPVEAGCAHGFTIL